MHGAEMTATDKTPTAGQCPVERRVRRVVDEQERDMQGPDYRTAEEYYADMARAENWQRTHGDWAPGLPPATRIVGRTVVVEYVNPPMELRDFDYCAHFLSNDLGDPQGYGITAAAALEDLLEKCE